MKKNLLLISSILMTMSGVCSCSEGGIGAFLDKQIGVGDDVETVQKDKTQLYVAVNDGGYGSAWVDSIATRFEEKYKDVSFEEGKQGVQIMIDQNSRYKGSKLVNELPQSDYEIFFTEGVNYYDLVTRNLILDITDVVTNDLRYDFISKQTATTGETGTIENKIISKDLSNFLKTDDNKYYALPYFDAYYGIIYDVDLFEENNLFLAASGEGDKKGFVLDETTKKSNGIDGVYGTYDDGLPATYDDFFKLCDHMVEIGITPFTWSGKVQEYLSYFLQALSINYDGVANAKCDYYFEGEVTTYVSGFDESGKPIETTKYIEKEESYELNNKRAGKYYALDFLDRVIDNTNYYDETVCFSQSVSHLDAQQNFLYPRYYKNNGSEVAMLIDGTWWQNEASGKFESLTKAFGESASAKNRKFGIMPLPRVNESKIGTPFVISNGGSSYCLIKSGIKESKVDLAKAFLQFVHTNESLCEFTSVTSATRPFNYSFEEASYNELTYFGKQAYNVHKSADYLIPYSKDADYIRNSAKVGYMWMSRVNNSDYGLPSFALHNNRSFTARDIFEGLSNFYTPNYWNTNFGPFTNSTK